MISGALQRFRRGLSKTRTSVVGKLSILFGGKVRLDSDTLEKIEELLISADMGVNSSLAITRNIEKRLQEEGGEATLASVLQVIRHDVKQILTTATPRVHPPAWDEIAAAGDTSLGRSKQRGRQLVPQGKKGKKRKKGKKGEKGKDRKALRGAMGEQGQSEPSCSDHEIPVDRHSADSGPAASTAARPVAGSPLANAGIQAATAPLHVVFVVGVNGTGKTTSIAKLAAHYQEQGRSVLLAAADTFRAAAVEQLEVWAERVGVPCVRQASGADPAAVVYDALAAAQARGHDVVIVDTAGRLHTKTNLMAELGKVERVIEKKAGRPPETLLVVDANTGQNGLAQARVFAETIPVDGLILTKLDGTAKGGIVVAIAETLGLPVKYVGIGEKVEDLAPFDADQFVDTLFADWQSDDEADRPT